VDAAAVARRADQNNVGGQDVRNRWASRLLSLPVVPLASRTPVTACRLRTGRCLRRLLLLLRVLALAKRFSRSHSSCIFRWVRRGVCVALPFAQSAARS
jgi:hypothetical protein